MTLIPTAPPKRASGALESPRPNKKRRRDGPAAIPRLIPTEVQINRVNQIISTSAPTVAVEDTTVNPAAGPSTLPALLPYTPIPLPAKPPKQRTHNRLPPPKPQPVFPAHLSATNPLREQTGIGKARDVIYVTTRTSLGAYLKRCKSLLVDQGLNKVTLHALTASIPHAMILLHALLDVLPYPAQHVRYELRTSTVECVDELLVAVEEQERDASVGGKAGKKGKASGATGKTGPVVTGRPDGAPSTASGANPIVPAAVGCPAPDPIPAAESSVPSDRRDQDTGPTEHPAPIDQAGDVQDEAGEAELLRMMMQGVNPGGEVADAGFRTRNKSALEIIIRIGKPPHNGSPRSARQNPPAPSPSIRFVDGAIMPTATLKVPMEKNTSGKIDGTKNKASATQPIKKPNRPSKAKRTTRKRRAGNMPIDADDGSLDASGNNIGDEIGGAEDEEEAMMNAM